MFVRRPLLSLAIFALLFSLLPSRTLRAQSGAVRRPQTPPAEQENPEKIYTEEVRIPVFAFDEKGRLDARLEVDDVLVVEDDVPQQVRSVARIPASVLFLLHTGGEMNLFLRTSTTRDIAASILSTLREEDRALALQVTGRAEVLQDWTTDKKQAARTLRSRLISGKGSNLSEGLARASELLQKEPIGNRHVIVITDGVDTASVNEYQAAIKKVIAAQATLHVISYTALGQKELKKREKQQKEAIGMAQSRQDIATAGIDPTRPPGMRGPGINPPQTNGGVRFDPALNRQRKIYRDAMRRGEARLKSLADETGGRLLLSASTDELVEQSHDIAREIDAQYVVTYRPKRPLAISPATEYRYVRVGARRIGLQLRTRRGYIVSAMRTGEDEANSKEPSRP